MSKKTARVVERPRPFPAVWDKRSPDKPCTETPLTGSFPTTRPATVVVPLPVPFQTGFEGLPRICPSPVD